MTYSDSNGLIGMSTEKYDWQAYQEAPAVPKPPAAILPGQHEWEGLTAEQSMSINACTERHLCKKISKSLLFKKLIRIIDFISFCLVLKQKPTNMRPKYFWKIYLLI